MTSPRDEVKHLSRPSPALVAGLLFLSGRWTGRPREYIGPSDPLTTGPRPGVL